jgi:hypothetical protein
MRIKGHKKSCLRLIKLDDLLIILPINNPRAVAIVMRVRISAHSFGNAGHPKPTLAFHRAIWAYRKIGARSRPI